MDAFWTGVLVGVIGEAVVIVALAWLASRRPDPLKSDDSGWFV